MRRHDKRSARWTWTSVVMMALACASRAPAEPRALAPRALGFIADTVHADLDLTNMPMVASPTVSLLTIGAPAAQAPARSAARTSVPPRGARLPATRLPHPVQAPTTASVGTGGVVAAPAAATAAPAGEQAGAESPIKKRARARREAAEQAEARRSRRPTHRHHASARRGEEEIRDEARAALPQPAARRSRRLFDSEQRSSFDTLDEAGRVSFSDVAPLPILPEGQCDGTCQVDDDDHPHLDRISIRGEATFLTRDRENSFTLAQSVNAAGVADGRGILALDNVQGFDGAAGFRTALLYRCNSHDAIEASYFGGNEWNEAAQVNALPGSLVASNFLGGTIATPDNSFGVAVLATYHSQVHDGQLNWVRAFDNGGRKNTRYILGLRYFTWRDDLDLTGSGAGGLAERTRVVAENDVVGPQIGVDYRHRVANKLDYGVVVKGGILANFAHQKTTNTAGAAPGGTGTDLLVANASDTGTSAMLDGLVQLMYRPWRNFMVRGGYQVVYAQQLALAPENLLATGTALRDAPNTPLPAGTGGDLDTSGVVWLGGAFVGGEIRF